MILKMENSDDFPTEIQNQLVTFHGNLEKMGDILQTLLQFDFDDERLTPLEKARLHLTSAYTMNSLFWMYLVCKGENPKEHPIKAEIDRIKMYMLRAKEIADKEKAPKIDKEAAKRFVRSSLWEPDSDGPRGKSALKSLHLH
ncbi:nuclear nucleic acid-binding protein C1D isoform X2 [Centruroides vittatus]|uniref:nuclear nucleic acid-binding protein C1D isoform X2 n=1 Tax=Centruroides vittatus TaxID=120091 RepID=UPI00350F8572